MARILITESRQDVGRLLERMLTRMGHEPIRVRVPDTEQLISADLAIVEPVESVGVLLAQAASIVRPSLPLVCASVSEPPAELAELGVSFNACLIKPFTAKELEIAIDQALHATQTLGNDDAEAQQSAGTELSSGQSGKQAARPVLSRPRTDSAAPNEMVEEPMTIRRRVLLVDDDQDVHRAVCAGLEAGDWSVTPVECGEAALDSVATAGPFDAVLLDVAMPGMGGPATLEGLRECGLPEEAPVIFLTTNAEDRERQALIFLGGIGTIPKPINSLAFLGEVERLLPYREPIPQ
jgi:two-component system OmpR family response regulator